MEPIVALTTMTKETYIRFNQFHIRRRGTMTVIMTLGIIGVITLAIGSALAVTGDPDAGRSQIMVGGVLVVMLFAMILSLRSQQKRYFDKAPTAIKLPHQYLFGDSTITADTLSDSIHNHGDYFYADLQKVYETPTDFYLYISANQAIILPKDSLRNASPEALRALLQSRIDPKKYICRAK